MNLKTGDDLEAPSMESWTPVLQDKHTLSSLIFRRLADSIRLVTTSCMPGRGVDVAAPLFFTPTGFLTPTFFAAALTVHKGKNSIFLIHSQFHVDEWLVFSREWKKSRNGRFYCQKIGGQKTYPYVAKQTKISMTTSPDFLTMLKTYMYMYGELVWV